MTNIDLVKKVQEIVSGYTTDASKELQDMGEALVKIGKALEGRPPDECRRILASVAILNGYRM